MYSINIIALSLVQIIIDILQSNNDKALIKFIVMILFSLILNLLCINGLGIFGLFNSFIPFIMMTYITTLIFFVLGTKEVDKDLEVKELEEEIYFDGNLSKCYKSCSVVEKDCNKVSKLLHDYDNKCQMVNQMRIMNVI